MIFRSILVCIVFLAAQPAAAQQQDSVFASYAELRNFVDSKLMARDFIPVIQSLGGRDEYTTEQLAGLNQQFLGIYPKDLENAALVRHVPGDNGFSKEAITYWTGTSYLWLYLFLHQREDDIVVINFTINSNADRVMEKL